MRLGNHLAVAAAVLLLLGGVDAHAEGADRLDRSFGQDGRVTVPRAYAAAVAPNGSMILTSKRPVVGFGSGSPSLNDENSLRRLAPDGKLDRSFGEGGVVTPPPVAGGAFALAGVAVDSQGRIVVAGTSTPPQPPSSAPPPSPPAFDLLKEPIVTTARILRYLPNGTLDPSFGDQGIVETDFGLPPPMNEGVRLAPKPLIMVTGVAIDDSGRIVLTGGAGAGLRNGCGHDWFWNVLTYAAFVARLTESGVADTSFGRNGLSGGLAASENPLQAEVGTEPIISPGGAVTFLRKEGACPAAADFPGAAQLTAVGAPIGLGEPLPSRSLIAAAAAAEDGSVYLLELPPQSRKAGKPWYVRVLSLGPGGALNQAFGQRGRVTVRLPGREQSEVESIAVDSGGRVLLGGVEFAHPPDENGTRRGHPSLLLMRLRAQGGRDSGSGVSGATVTRFPSLNPRATPRLLLDGQARAILSGQYWRGKGNAGLAAVRYVLGP